MALGTGIVQGPIQYNQAPGVTAAYTQDDPRSANGMASTSVQIQNNAPLPVQVTAGGDEWSITSAQSSTIPLPPDGSGVVWTVTNPGSSQVTGFITFIWLLDSQEAPQPDGPLSGQGSGSGN